MIAEGVQEPPARNSTSPAGSTCTAGLAYQLQGWFGRQANAMLNAGLPMSADSIIGLG